MRSVKGHDIVNITNLLIAKRKLKKGTLSNYLNWDDELKSQRLLEVSLNRVGVPTRIASGIFPRFENVPWMGNHACGVK